jgi:hypothetical protein
MTSVIIEDYSPIVVGDTGAAFHATVVQGGQPVTTGGITFATKFVKTDGTKSKNAVGAWTAEDAPTGRWRFDPDALDINESGEWTMWVTVTIGGKPIHARPKFLQIDPTP